MLGINLKKEIEFFTLIPRGDWVKEKRNEGNSFYKIVSDSLIYLKKNHDAFIPFGGP